MQITTVPGDLDDETAPLCFAVAEEDTGKRLDVVLTGASEALGEVFSRTRIKGLIEDGRVTLDGVPVLDAKHKVKAGQEIALSVPPAIDAEPRGEDLPVNVVFEDEHLIIIDKPAG